MSLQGIQYQLKAKEQENKLLLSQVTAQHHQLTEQGEKLRHIETCLAEANKTIAFFKEQIKLGQARHFGRQSETSQHLQFTLFDADEADEIEATISPSEDAADEQIITYRRKKSQGRNIDTSQLPREQQVHDISEAEKCCACGCQRHKIGEDRTEELVHIPAVLKVIEHIVPKYACRQCDTIMAAKRPLLPLPKSMASSTLIADVVLKKYDHHLPLYRQSKILAQNGIDIPDNTLGNWVMNAAQALSPLADALWQQLDKVTWLQADETPVKILKPDKKGYLWGYHSLNHDNRFVVFEFALTRAATVPQARLGTFAGFLQTDGYAGYRALGQCARITHLGCWDHARRKFTDAIKINASHKTGMAGKLLKHINRLYRIEREQKQATPTVRYQARQTQSKPVLDAIYALANTVNAPPKSVLGKAVTYLLNNAAYLRVYVDHGEAHISNCLMENHIRPLALGRKNWLFVGNEVSANRSAFWYSLIQTCKINTINPRQYLVTVLNHVHDMRRGNIDPATMLPQFIDKALLAD